MVNTLRGEKLDLASAVKAGLIEYIPFPEALKGKYQAYTQADLTNLRDAGYDAGFHTVEQGVGTAIDF